ncbi:MAG: hypothetical protein M1816_005168 [Peltula sp. TS41687]|nr:MAG: hypothetical protein M1816_005168 [Peltula sp. TS41687]
MSGLLPLFPNTHDTRLYTQRATTPADTVDLAVGMMSDGGDELGVVKTWGTWLADILASRGQAEGDVTPSQEDDASGMLAGLGI